MDRAAAGMRYLKHRHATAENCATQLFSRITNKSLSCLYEPRTESRANRPNRSQSGIWREVGVIECVEHIRRNWKRTLSVPGSTFRILMSQLS